MSKLTKEELSPRKDSGVLLVERLPLLLFSDPKGWATRGVAVGRAHGSLSAGFGSAENPDDQGSLLVGAGAGARSGRPHGSLSTGLEVETDQGSLFAGSVLIGDPSRSGYTKSNHHYPLLRRAVNKPLFLDLGGAKTGADHGSFW